LRLLGGYYGVSQTLDSRYCLRFDSHHDIEQSLPGIHAKQLMTPQEFQATGLVKLNDQELKAPDEWLARFASVVITILCQTQSRTVQQVVQHGDATHLYQQPAR
jgi:hypothetical protein